MGAIAVFRVVSADKHNREKRPPSDKMGKSVLAYNGLQSLQHQIVRFMYVVTGCGRSRASVSTKQQKSRAGINPFENLGV